MRPVSSLLLVLAVIGLDRLTKFLVAKQDSLSTRVIQNPGLPFGINLPGFFDILVVAALLVLFVFFYFRYLASPDLTVGFGLIIGGALANILDRFPDGAVTDFINVGISTINFADIAIMGGIVWLILGNLKFKNQNLW